MTTATHIVYDNVIHFVFTIKRVFIHMVVCIIDESVRETIKKS